MIPDQQAMIERIVKLQRMLAKKQDKVEFLNEHAKQLMDALQKKRKIIQSYAMCQDSGALSSDISDQNKVINWKVSLRICYPKGMPLSRNISYSESDRIHGLLLFQYN